MTAAEITGRHVVADKPGAGCAACRADNDLSRMTRSTLRQGDGNPVLIMLCNDARACGQRYRKGLTPKAYGSMVRRGLMP